MQLWIHWWWAVWQLRPACGRLRTFLWLAVCLAGMGIREDLFGVTSIIRVIGLKEMVSISSHGSDPTPWPICHRR